MDNFHSIGRTENKPNGQIKGENLTEFPEQQNSLEASTLSLHNATYAEPKSLTKFRLILNLTAFTDEPSELCTDVCLKVLKNLFY